MYKENCKKVGIETKHKRDATPRIWQKRLRLLKEWTEKTQQFYSKRGMEKEQERTGMQQIGGKNMQGWIQERTALP
jgi:hypothetical protein